MEFIHSILMLAYIAIIAGVAIGAVSIIYKMSFVEVIFNTVALVWIFTVKGFKKVKEMVYI